MDYCPPGSSVYGILQARILEWVAFSSSRESSQPRDWTWVSRISSLWKGYVHLFFSQVGRIRLFPLQAEQRHFNRQRGSICWGRPLNMIIITTARKSKSKKQFQHGVRIGVFSATAASIHLFPSYHLSKINSLICVQFFHIFIEIMILPYNNLVH